MSEPELTRESRSDSTDIVEASMAFYEESATGARRVGMLDREMLHEAVQDPRTITAVLADGREIAALVPIEYAAGAGYDVRRCTEEIVVPGHQNETWAYMPSGNLLKNMDDEGYGQLVRRLATIGDGYVFSSYGEFDDPRNSSQVELTALLHDAGKVIADVPLRDPRARGNEDASLSLYGVDVPRREDAKDRPLVSWEDIYKTYEEKVAAGVYKRDMQNGTVLLRGSDLTDEHATEMWDLYYNRFEWLGENHPISMEDTKGDFMKVLRSSSALCSIRFKDGKPVCFTDIVGNTDELYWLNKSFLEDHERMDMEPNQRLVFFPGIVASQDGMNSSYEVMGLLANVFTDANASLKIVFENTNRSEMYIPRIVRRSANQSGRLIVETPTVIDKTRYYCTHFLENTNA